MKALIVVFLFISCFAAKAQESKTSLPIDFQKKNRQQKIAAWTLLSTGFVSTFIGTVIATKEVVKIVVIPWPGGPLPDDKKLNGGAAFIICGSAAMMGSIPLFIAAGRNKRKIKTMTANLKFENFNSLNKASLVLGLYPALAVHIKI